MSGASSTSQWIRKASLVVYNAGNSPSPGIDLSEFRFKFETKAFDTESPNSMRVRVYNVGQATAQSLTTEFTRVVLQAGYINGNFGIIFDGTIAQTRRGKESNTDTYVDIFAIDGDVAYNYSTVFTTLGPGTTSHDAVNALVSEMQKRDPNIQPPPWDQIDALPLLHNARGKVMAGMASDIARQLGQSMNTRISIQNGQVTLIPVTGYLQGEAVKLNSQTGLVGMPETTQQGVELTCLLNSKLRVGNLIQIANKEINDELNTVTSQVQSGFPSWQTTEFFANTSADGFYKAFVIEHEGDTRGNPWYSHLICLAVDPTQPRFNAVAAFGSPAGGP